MRDRSMVVDFQVGDYVRVIKDVTQSGQNWNSKEGKVVSVWEVRYFRYHVDKAGGHGRF